MFREIQQSKEENLGSRLIGTSRPTRGVFELMWHIALFVLLALAMPSLAFLQTVAPVNRQRSVVARNRGGMNMLRASYVSESAYCGKCGGLCVDTSCGQGLTVDAAAHVKGLAVPAADAGKKEGLCCGCCPTDCPCCVLGCTC